MSDIIISLYFSTGVALTQLLHTKFSHDTFGQKEVLLLEAIPGFSREPPIKEESKRGRWGNHPQATEELRDFGLISPLFPPWKLPHIQLKEEKTPMFLKMVGLHATNLVYCYIMSIFYGVLAFFIVRGFLPIFEQITSYIIIEYASVMIFLLVFSFFAVGGGISTLIEGGIAFNAFILTLLASGIISYQASFQILQFGAALTVGPIIFWLNFQREKGNIEYGSLIQAYYVLIPILYSEFLVLLLGLLY